MAIFVTGTSGWIGSAVVPELLQAGHKVVGLARSDDAAAAVTALGAEVRRGELGDLDGLRAAAAASDGVVHLGYNHDFSRMADAARTDAAAIVTLCEALAGSDRPFLFASGVLGLATGRPGTEQDIPDAAVHPRVGNGRTALAYADRGVRPMAIRFAPTVHGAGDHGFVAVLVAIARQRGVSGYIEDGANRWPAVHRLDAGDLVRRALETGAAGTSWHAVDEQGVPAREIAEAIGRGLGLPVTSVPAEEAGEHFGWMARFFGADCPTSNAITRERLGWTPSQPGLIDDLDAGHYFG